MRAIFALNCSSKKTPKTKKSWALQWL